ncbi:MAG TPA: cytochrome c [Terriglobales bacterium]|nr:cytochrome c [Terriglobales bacterium]
MRGRRWHLPAVFAVLVPAILTGWTLTAVSAETSSPSPTASALPGDPNAGSQVFSQQGCVTCHGANLEGGIGAKLNPIQKFPDVPNPLDPNYLRTTIRNGRSGDPGFSAQMPAFTPDKLSDKDLNDVVAFIIAQNQSGQAGLGPVELARSNVFWVSVSIFLLVIVTWLLARYNMRWIARRAAARRG